MSQNEKLKIFSKNSEEIEIISLEGYLDAHTASYLEDFIQQTIDGKKFKIIFDFSKLDYISSAGLGVFMAFVEEIRGANGDMKFCCMKENVFSVFDLLGFPMLFDIEENHEKCLIKFSNENLKDDE